MSPNIGDSFSFLPWVKNKLTTKARLATGTPISYRPTVPVTVTLNVSGGGASTLDVVRELAVHGPGDVIGLQPEAVLKTTPPAGEQQYPALLLASIEFGEEDLPWRYSPEEIPLSSTDVKNKQVNPWCFLLVLKSSEFTILPQGSAPLASILVTAPADAFPPKETRWAWAHVQSNTQLGDEATGFSDSQAQTFLEQPLKQNPDLAFARIVSPRRLEPNTAYHAFLVPSYETGRLAGLGLDITTASAADQCAWGSGTAATSFPVYYQWDFQTSDDIDFEALARLLQPEVPVDFGTQPLALTTPVSSASSTLPTSRQYILNLPGVIQEVGAPAMHVPVDIGKDFYATLKPAVQARRRRPILTPPVYGRNYATTDLHNPNNTTTTNWFDQVNLHPGYRSLAALGSQVIQDNQEEYMQRAWEQVRDIIVANQNLRGMQQGLEATDSMRHQHLPVTGGAARGTASFQFAATASTTTTSSGAAEFSQPNELQARSADSAAIAAADTGEGKFSPQYAAEGAAPPTQFKAAAVGPTDGGMENYGLHLAGLSFTRLRDSNTGLTLQETVRQSNVPLAAFNPTFRRILKPFGRYQTNLAGRPRRPTLPPEPANPNPAMPPTLLEKNQNLQQRDALLSLLVDGTITAAPPKYGPMLAYQFDDKSVNQILADYQEVKNFWVLAEGGDTSHYAVNEGEQYSQFVKAFASFAAVRFTPDEPKPPLELDLPALKQVVIEGTKPGPVFLARANRAIRFLPHYGASDLLASMPSAPVPVGTASNFAARTSVATNVPTATVASTTGPLTAVQPVMAYPVFKDPMGNLLKQKHPDLFLPNLGEFPNNTVALLEYNHAFIEAYMLGLNHAFGSELLWREYPTDLRGSYFRQFWDVSEFLLMNPPQNPTVENLALQEEQNRDIKPVVDWANNLGSNRPGTGVTSSTFGDVLLLAVRADLLKRYPNTVVCAAPGVPVNGTTLPLEPDLTNVIYPAHRTMLGEDVILFSFLITAAEARGNFAAGKWGYFFVFHERPGELQFGLDMPPSTPPPFSAPATWNDLHWGHLGVPSTSGANDNITANGLVNTQIQATGVPFRKISTSAEFAYATFQQPFLVAFHAQSMLSPV